MQKQELEHHAKDAIFIVLVDVDYTGDYQPDLKQSQVNNGARKMDYDLNGSKLHESLVKPNIN